MLKSPRNNILCKLDKAFEDTIVTQSGIKLYRDTHFKPEWNTTTTAEVVAAPHTLDSIPDFQGLTVEVKAGDEIIISYMVVGDMDLRDRDTPVHHNRFYFNGETYWKAAYYFYLGKVVGEKLIPAQGYIFCEQVDEQRPEKIGLIWVPEMTQKEKPKGKAKVISVGKPLNGEADLGIEEGEIVKFNPGFAQKYEVKGRNIIILKQSQILATL